MCYVLHVREGNQRQRQNKILKTIRCINKSIEDYNDKNTFHEKANQHGSYKKSTHVPIEVKIQVVIMC